MTRFKPQVGNVKTGQTTGRFTVINPYFYFYKRQEFIERKEIKVHCLCRTTTTKTKKYVGLD